MDNIKFDMDVVVVGGGTAGVAAAISAARNGQRTLLLESEISLGGLATNCYVTGIAGHIEGICQEWLDRLAAEGNLVKRAHVPSIDPEKGKFMLERMLLQSKARILYGVNFTEAEVEGNRIKDLICYSRSGRMIVSAGVYIDASGDASVAASAGVPCEVGSPQFAGLNMSTTLAFRMANVNMDKYGQTVQAWRAKEALKDPAQRKRSVLVELEETAVKNGDLPFFIFPAALIYAVPNTSTDDSDIVVMTCHSFYCRNTDVEDLTRQIIEQHNQIEWMEKFFVKYVPGFEKARVTGLACLHGVRESRRIVGEYVLKDEDLVCGTKFEDAIARYDEMVDTHHPTSPRLGFQNHVHLAQPKAGVDCRPAQYDGDMNPFVNIGGYVAKFSGRDYCEIPYRSIVPLKIDNLLVVGRCASAEFHASSITRLIGSCMSTGQASGVAAAISLKSKVPLRYLDARDIRQRLIEQGVPLDKPIKSKWAEKISK